jgi:MFS family permease
MTQTANTPSAPVTARPTSMFVSGAFPRRRLLVVGLSVLAGFLLTVVWSASFVDQTIGDNVADTMLGHHAKDAPIGGILSGIAFALASGVAGTFTACNIAVFGTLAPLIGQNQSARGRMLQTLRPIGWLSAGMIAVSATYGAIVGIVGTHLPQFSTARPATGLSPRTIQAMVVFGIIGFVMLWLGLAALGVVPDPLGRVSARFPNAPLVLMGALIGGFLIGRPFALFRQMFRDAAESHNPLYGALAFSLQSIGNIVIVTVIFMLMALLAGRRLRTWISAKPSRTAVMVGAALITVGAFTMLYWDVRILAARDIIWYPRAPWA